jgi:hypothetical protein
MAMATLGLIEHMAAGAERADLPAVDEMIGSINGLVEAVGYYLTPEMSPATRWTRTVPRRSTGS